MSAPPSDRSDPDSVWQRFRSAELRAADLLALNDGDLGGADTEERQRLVQEFFFHLVGAIEFFAQVINERRGLGASPDDVSIAKIADRLEGDPLEAPVRDLYVNPNKTPFPSDPYDRGGYLWRIYNYRHQVTHRGFNPFHFHLRLGDAALSTAGSPPAENPTAHFLLDPLDPARGPSRETVRDDIREIITLVRTRINAVLAVL